MTSVDKFNLFLIPYIMGGTSPECF